MSDAFGHLTRRTATRALNHRRGFVTQIATPPVRRANRVEA